MFVNILKDTKKNKVSRNCSLIYHVLTQVRAHILYIIETSKVINGRAGKLS